MHRLILSGEAFDDLVDIQNYTFTEFGEQQWKTNNDLLENAFQQLLDHPMSGCVLQDILSEYRVLNAGHHVIIYRIEEATIYVIRILHQRMDFRF